jgi:potassium inwardly-rectifying channel subfamily J
MAADTRLLGGNGAHAASWHPNSQVHAITASSDDTGNFLNVRASSEPNLHRPKLFGPEGSCVAIREPTAGGPFRLLSRGASKPNMVGRSWRDRMSYRWHLNDWFHPLVHQKTWRLILVFSIAYMLLIMLFAIVYFVIDQLTSCHIGLHGGFRAAFFFSLETHATIGYGVPGADSSFHECNSMIVALYLQTFIALLSDAVLIGLLFARMSRGTNRAVSVVFSEKAIIVKHCDEHYLIFQVFDKRRDALVEANIRLFCYVHHELNGRRFPYNRACRLTHPNPDDGAVLLTYTSTMVIHKLSESSPIVSAAKLAGYSRDVHDAFDPEGLLEALRALAHFEIIVEVNGVENVTTAQVQARWSFLIGEIEYDEDEDMCWETPDVHVSDGKAQVHRTAVANWHNRSHHEELVATVGQLAHAMAFHVPVEESQRK